MLRVASKRQQSYFRDGKLFHWKVKLIPLILIYSHYVMHECGRTHLCFLSNRAHPQVEWSDRLNASVFSPELDSSSCAMSIKLKRLLGRQNQKDAAQSLWFGTSLTALPSLYHRGVGWEFVCYFFWLSSPLFVAKIPCYQFCKFATDRPLKNKTTISDSRRFRFCF